MSAGSPTTGSQRSLILGAYGHLPVEALEPFARSLRATGFEGSFHVVAAGYEVNGVRALEALADHVRHVDAEYSRVLPRTSTLLGYARRQRGLRRFYPSLFEAVARAAPERQSLERWRNLEFQLEGLQSLRYWHYYTCLVEDAPDAELVMITDLRDVVFQRDPFAEPVACLELYAEDSSEQIGSAGFNTRWLRNLYGQEFVEAHHGQPFSCCGTVIGTRATMLAYLTEMIAGIVWRRRPMSSHDQGVHNWLIQTGRLTYGNLIPNEHGRVLTLGRMASPRLNDDGHLVNADGSVPSVIHQWDRHPWLVKRLSALRPRGA